MIWNESMDRRGMVRATACAAVAALVAYRRSAALPLPSGAGQHPEPRPGIDGARVLSAEDLAARPDLVPLFDGIRAIPEVADGIRCSCGCADVPDVRSLLSCYEAPGMALHCNVCQGTGRMAVRLHAEGRTLDGIRAAIDARYG